MRGRGCFTLLFDSCLGGSGRPVNSLWIPAFGVTRDDATGVSAVSREGGNPRFRAAGVSLKHLTPQRELRLCHPSKVDE